MSRDRFFAGLTKRQHQTLNAAVHRAEAGVSVFDRMGRPRKHLPKPLTHAGWYPAPTWGYEAISPKSLRMETV